MHTVSAILIQPLGSTFMFLLVLSWSLRGWVLEMMNKTGLCSE